MMDKAGRLGRFVTNLCMVSNYKLISLKNTHFLFQSHVRPVRIQFYQSHSPFTCVCSHRAHEYTSWGDDNFHIQGLLLGFSCLGPGGSPSLLASVGGCSSLPGRPSLFVILLLNHQQDGSCIFGNPL